MSTRLEDLTVAEAASLFFEKWVDASNVIEDLEKQLKGLPPEEPVLTDREIVNEIQKRSTTFEYFSEIGMGYAEALANSAAEDCEQLLRIVQKLLIERKRVEQLPKAWRHNKKFMGFDGSSAAKQEAENCAHDLDNTLKMYRVL